MEKIILQKTCILRVLAILATKTRKCMRSTLHGITKRYYHLEIFERIRQQNAKKKSMENTLYRKSKQHYQKFVFSLFFFQLHRYQNAKTRVKHCL